MAEVTDCDVGDTEIAEILPRGSATTGTAVNNETQASRIASTKDLG